MMITFPKQIMKEMIKRTTDHRPGRVVHLPVPAVVAVVHDRNHFHVLVQSQNHSINPVRLIVIITRIVNRNQLVHQVAMVKERDEDQVPEREIVVLIVRHEHDLEVDHHNGAVGILVMAVVVRFSL